MSTAIGEGGAFVSSAVIGVDYRNLFSRSMATDFIAKRIASDAVAIQDHLGHNVRSTVTRDKGYMEYCSFRNDVLVVATDNPKGLRGRSEQKITDGDWLHFQFRISGGGSEIIPGSQSISTPSRSCAVFRYPEGSTIIRDFNLNESWKAVCLYVRPASICEFFDVSISSFAEGLEWLSDPSRSDPHAVVMPMDLRIRRAAEEILSAHIEGDVRRTYLKAKSLELFALAVHDLKERAARRVSKNIRSPEFRKLHRVTEILERNIESPTSLAALARQVGTNRTRLAEMFKECNGICIHEYWRTLRLNRAMDLLSSERIQVTEVAAKVGYANVSSFSRAFSRKFGVAPKDVRPSRAPN